MSVLLKICWQETSWHLENLKLDKQQDQEEDLDKNMRALQVFI